MAQKIEKTGFITLCRIKFRFQNCPCFYSRTDSFWLLFFWRFKNTFYRRAEYIYNCIYWVSLWCLEAINASNQETICSCMIFQSSCFILYFIFLWTWSFSMPFSIMTSPRYYDVTRFLTDLDENFTTYVKLKIKDILFVRIFLFSEYLFRKLWLITKKTSIV